MFEDGSYLRRRKRFKADDSVLGGQGGTSSLHKYIAIRGAMQESPSQPSDGNYRPFSIENIISSPVAAQLGGPGAMSMFPAPSADKTRSQGPNDNSSIGNLISGSGLSSFKTNSFFPLTPFGTTSNRVPSSQIQENPINPTFSYLPNASSQNSRSNATPSLTPPTTQTSNMSHNLQQSSVAQLQQQPGALSRSVNETNSNPANTQPPPAGISFDILSSDHLGGKPPTISSSASQQQQQHHFNLQTAKVAAAQNALAASQHGQNQNHHQAMANYLHQQLNKNSSLMGATMQQVHSLASPYLYNTNSFTPSVSINNSLNSPSVYKMTGYNPVAGASFGSQVNKLFPHNPSPGSLASSPFIPPASPLFNTQRYTNPYSNPGSVGGMSPAVAAFPPNVTINTNYQLPPPPVHRYNPAAVAVALMNNPSAAAANSAANPYQPLAGLHYNPFSSLSTTNFCLPTI